MKTQTPVSPSRTAPEGKSDLDDALTVLRHISLVEINQRIEDIDGERAALMLLRQSLAVRERALRRGMSR